MSFAKIESIIMCRVPPREKKRTMSMVETELQHEKEMEVELRHEIDADESTISSTRKMLSVTMLMLVLSVFLNFGMTW
jgi:hypothetical protein